MTTDDVGLVWLADKSKLAEVVKALEAKKADLAIAEIISGEALAKTVADPTCARRTSSFSPKPGSSTPSRRRRSLPNMASGVPTTATLRSSSLEPRHHSGASGRGGFDGRGLCPAFSKEA